MSDFGLDDLFEQDAEPVRRAPRRRGGPRWWLGTLLGAAALTAVTLLGLRAVDVTLNLLVVFCAFTALLTLRRFTGAVAPAPGPGGRGGNQIPDDNERPHEPDALRTAVARWERLLNWAAVDGDRFRRRIAPRIGEIADERLRQRHGLTRQSDPARARALLGDEAWTLLTSPPRRGPSPKECATIVASLEKM